MCQFSRGILILLISGLLTNGKETIKTAKAECTLGNNTECSLRSKQHTISGPNESVNWSIGITDTLFSYTLETAENGEDLLVGGIVTCKLLIANWLKEKNQTVDGIRVTLIDEEKNETMQIYDTELRGDFLVNETTPEFRLDFDNVLLFNKTYRVKVDLLPLGKPTNYAKWNNQQVLYVEPRLRSQQCELMTKLAQKWSPQLSIDVYEASSKLSVTWRIAPHSLCIFSYKLTAYNKNRTFFHENIIEDMGDSTFLVDELRDVPRDQRLTVMVNAQVMTYRQCVCPKCNCNHKKKRRIVIPSWKNATSKPTPKMIFNSADYSTSPIHSSSPSPKVNENTLFYTLFIIVIVLLIIIAIILCIFTAHTSTKYREHMFFKLINNFIPFYNKDTYRILLVCPNITGEEKEYMARICEAFRQSKHRVVCNIFEEDSRRAEQNILHWMYRETAACQNIVIFNSSMESSPHGLYNILTSSLTIDNRVVNVLLSEENAIIRFVTETNFTLPRDERRLEEAFDIGISQPPVRESPIPERKVEFVFDPIPKSLEDHAVDTIDSGVSSMSSSSSDTQENFSETLFQSDPDIDVNIKCDNHPLLQHAEQMEV